MQSISYLCTLCIIYFSLHKLLSRHLYASELNLWLSTSLVSFFTFWIQLRTLFVRVCNCPSAYTCLLKFVLGINLFISIGIMLQFNGYDKLMLPQNPHMCIIDASSTLMILLLLLFYLKENRIDLKFVLLSDFFLANFKFFLRY